MKNVETNNTLGSTLNDSRQIKQLYVGPFVLKSKKELYRIDRSAKAYLWKIVFWFLIYGLGPSALQFCNVLF